MLEEKIRKEVVELAAKLMIASAQTAPKSKGEDSLEVMYLSDFEEIDEKNGGTG